ncbi:ankyrin repeat domain-containing protein [Streptomyces sp. ZAF1911]|uniref:HEAT repeat domain-containing protein n=1 Tax=Streptomyces sp. ZAF1911 TaxID=2944129 RepID=UPI00237B1A7C|nr:HEAT repeat domain-containing protein [Streptomyces sp. ZAF1911]MDD9375171.1 ankyrin repeat domain-containing protein [Streptomyces sp. ZAF1911]
MESGRELVAAVRRRDVQAVTVLLEAGADPHTVADDGLPVLCLAVAAYDTAVAGALVEGGADPDHVLPDATTPLLRAVDGGSWAMTKALLGDDPQRLPEAERGRLLALARRWYEQGAKAVLRDGARKFGPVREECVEDGEDGTVVQLTLGGLTVRDGHGAILTELECAFDIHTPVDELVARAMAAPQEEWDHVGWNSAVAAVAVRRDTETFLAVTAYRHHPDPDRRHFVLDVFDDYRKQFYRNIFSKQGIPFVKETADVLIAWATEGEESPNVLTRVLSDLGFVRHPELQAVGLRHAGHPDPRVRAETTDLIFDWGNWSTPQGAAKDALLLLAADENPRVRRRAGSTLIVGDDGTSEFTEALVALLQDPDFEVRKDMAEGIKSFSDEPRTPPVAAALAGVWDEIGAADG